MKKYNIVVNGTAYTVDVEELGSAGSAQASASASVQAPVPAASAPASVQTPTPAGSNAAPSAGARRIECPMPGTILDVKVVPGQAVKGGDILLVLEAMKMENEITAPGDGTVDTVQVTKGASVSAGDLLLTLK